MAASVPAARTSGGLGLRSLAQIPFEQHGHPRIPEYGVNDDFDQVNFQLPFIVNGTDSVPVFALDSLSQQDLVILLFLKCFNLNC